MSHQPHADTYRAAMEAAMGELDGLFEEAKRLRNRMELIDTAISALKVLAGTDMEPSSAVSMAQETSATPTPTKQKFDSALGLVFA